MKLEQKIKKICSQCFSFYFDTKHSKQSKYCSKKCRDIYYKKTGTGKFGKKSIQINCDGCGILFRTHKSRIIKSNSNYCSMNCSRHYENFKKRKAERKEFICLNCSKKIIDKWFTFRKYCSNKCFYEFKRIKINCKICFKKMNIPNNLFKKGKKYCSNKCKWKDGSNVDTSVLIKCLNCSKNISRQGMPLHLWMFHKIKGMRKDDVNLSKK